MKKMYFEAFPKEERVPWMWLMMQSRKQFIEFIAFYDEDQFVGFAYIISRQKLTYIFYLAVNSELRGGGYGSKILQDIFKMYEGQHFAISVEPIDDTADNAAQRRSRVKFYERNGFTMSSKLALEQGVKYSMMYHNSDFEKQDYIDLIAYYAGIFSGIFKTEFID